MSSLDQARDIATTIWNAAIEAVRAERLVDARVQLDAERLLIADQSFALSDIRRICVVGAGKAAGYLAVALESKLASIALVHGMHGLVNVPANCVEPTEFIALHAARPAGVNEPRQEGVEGTKKIRELVNSLTESDLCICLLTGGASALTPAPAPGLTLSDKLAVTRCLSAAGANIQDLNQVRIAMSTFKGGGLARACNAGRMVTLIISDIIGDPLDLIGSGPTVDVQRPPGEALGVLQRYVTDRNAIPQAVWDYFESETNEATSAVGGLSCRVENRLLANNATAVAAAANEARRHGFVVEILPPESADTAAETVGRKLADIMAMRASDAPSCIIWGGEPIVRLAPEDQRGMGGRNQQAVLAALEHWWRKQPDVPLPSRLCILSGGTDGEDGPTDAAGALLDAQVSHEARTQQLKPVEYLARNDAYRFFARTNGLIKTGPTHTNVCDVRVAVLV